MSGSLKKKIEAMLFATQGLTINKISEALKEEQEKVMKAINELVNDYKKRDSAFTIINEGELWKLTVKSEHVPVVKNLIPSEYPKSLLETLAVIAWKNPTTQSYVIKIRGNKAYNHINYLEQAGMITTSKKGRSKEIKLTDKFYEYFNANPTEIKNSLKINKEQNI